MLLDYKTYIYCDVYKIRLNNYYKAIYIERYFLIQRVFLLRHILKITPLKIMPEIEKDRLEFFEERYFFLVDEIVMKDF